jgi:CheY-like chemotaxis protein
MNTAPILYVEDDDNDAFLLQHAFKQAEISNPLVCLTGGEAALKYLSGTGPNENDVDHPYPSLVLVDLNMPGQSGFDVLQWIRRDPCCFGIPVVVLSSSRDEGDIVRAYSEHANGYLVKPNKPNELLAMVKALRDFWLALNQAPPPLNRTRQLAANSISEL